jgi:homoserine kinase
MDTVSVCIPASTSNLGPGFDCLGVALQLYNFVTVSRAQHRQSHPSIVNEAASLFFKRARVRRFNFSCTVAGEVPPSRGLGASATIRLGILHGLNRLAENPFDRLLILNLCAALERHPDNAAPSSFGGFTISRSRKFQRFDVSPRLHFVLLVPDFEIKTAKARKILPAKIARKAAVESCGNACSITAAFALRNYEEMRGAFADKLHQPFRTKLIPFLPRVVAAAEKAGALGGFLSGSGSSICAVTLRDPRKIGGAMKRAARSTSSRIIITNADNSGVRIQNRKSKI